jgi:hypothetical protein
MKIGGVSIILVLGIINFILLVFQILTGYHKIKVRIGTHKKAGWVLFAFAFIHGLIGILANAL